MKAREIADLVSGALSGDGEIEITGIADLKDAGHSDLAYTTRAAQELISRPGCLIAPIEINDVPGTVLIRVDEPKLAFALAAEALVSDDLKLAGIHPSSFIAPSAVLGNDVSVGSFVTVGERCVIGDSTRLSPGSVIGDDVSIGENCLIGSNTVVSDGCKIGNHVILHPGVVIGADGFGYVRGPGRHVKFPQVGTVVIEDDVEIGANSCVDRGALGETRIGKGTKIDNLVQIAHNVRIGERVVIAALSGISGSVVIEDDVTIAGQVGVSDHVIIQAGAVLAARSAVFTNKIVRPGVWCGTPIQPLEEYKKQNALLRSLDRLIRELRELKKLD